GEYDPVFFRRAVYLLYQNGQYRQAENLLAALQERALYLPDDMRWIRISILSQLGNHQLAVDEAAKPIRAGSKEPTDHYWYTQALAQAGRKEEAEKAYRDALQLPDVDKKQPELWVQFVFFLVQSEQKAKAEAVTQEVEKRLPAELAPLVLARCYEALGQTKKAEEQYLKALAKDPRQ